MSFLNKEVWSPRFQQYDESTLLLKNKNTENPKQQKFILVDRDMFVRYYYYYSMIKPHVGQAK